MMLLHGPNPRQTEHIAKLTPVLRYRPPMLIYATLTLTPEFSYRIVLLASTFLCIPCGLPHTTCLFLKPPVAVMDLKHSVF